MKYLALLTLAVFFVFTFGGPAEQIAKMLPTWAIWPLAIATGIGMAAAQYGPLILFARRYNRQHATQPR